MDVGNLPKRIETILHHKYTSESITQLSLSTFTGIISLAHPPKPPEIQFSLESISSKKNRTDLHQQLRVLNSAHVQLTQIQILPFNRFRKVVITRYCSLTTKQSGRPTCPDQLSCVIISANK